MRNTFNLDFQANSEFYNSHVKAVDSNVNELQVWLNYQFMFDDVFNYYCVSDRFMSYDLEKRILFTDIHAAFTHFFYEVISGINDGTITFPILPINVRITDCVDTIENFLRWSEMVSNAFDFFFESDFGTDFDSDQMIEHNNLKRLMTFILNKCLTNVLDEARDGILRTEARSAEILDQYRKGFKTLETA